MNPKLTAIVAALALAATACTEADCITELCAPLPPDSGLDAAGDTGSDGARDATGDGGGACGWAPVGACVGDCPDPATVSFDLRTIATASSPDLLYPVAIAADPTVAGRAIVLSSDGIVAEVRAEGDTLVFGDPWDLGIGPNVASSIGIAPDGAWAAVSVIDPTCVPGTVYFVDIDASPGEVLGTTTVGYWPDHVAVSPDGRYVVTADEDQREPCKPPGRRGGTVTVIDVSGGVSAATVAETIAVDHALNSEPEGVSIGEGGVVAVTVQETDEVLLFDLDALPASPVLYTLAGNSDPDGVSVDEALGFAAVAFERTDAIGIVDLETGALVEERYLILEMDVPSEYNRDTGDPVEVHEPEEPVFFRHQGAVFLALTVQESHAVLIYRVAADGSLTLDSVAPTGDYESELGGRTRSNIRPESLAVAEGASLVFTVNEGEATVTALGAAASTHRACE